MKCKFVHYFILLLLVAGWIACGDSSDDDEDSPVESVTSTTQTDSQTEDVGIIERPAVNFEDEEVQIRELFNSHADAVTERKIPEIMDHWLKLEKPELFMAWNFWNAFTRIETWKGVRESFAGTFEKFKNQMKVTVTEVGINARGKEATLRADYNWLQAGKLVAAFRKNSRGEWKILAIDFSNKDLIKWIETPKVQEE